MSTQLITPKGEITIRPATPEDAALLRELRLEALACHPEAFAADHTATAAGTIVSWAERIEQYAQENQGVICLTRVENQLIGMTGLVRGHWPKTRHVGALWGVYVNADWRGLGVAQALLEACADWARRQGLVMLKLGVLTTNAPAIRCYERCGFTTYGIDPKVLYYNGVYYDELLMAKTI